MDDGSLNVLTEKQIGIELLDPQRTETLALDQTVSCILCQIDWPISRLQTCKSIIHARQHPHLCSSCLAINHSASCAA